MTMDPARIEIEAERFMARYARAFDALDGNAVAALYAQPAGLLDSNGYTHWPTTAQTTVNMIALCAHYRSNGYLHNAFVLRRCIAHGEIAVCVDVGWTIYWRDRPPTRFGTGYVLRRNSGDWRIQLCTAYEETLASGGT